MRIDHSLVGGKAVEAFATRVAVRASRLFGVEGRGRSHLRSAGSGGGRCGHPGTCCGGRCRRHPDAGDSPWRRRTGLAGPRTLMQVHEQGKLNSPKHVADWLAAVGFDPPYCPSDVVMRMPDEHPDER